jgi:seryl-tRNA synthetase
VREEAMYGTGQLPKFGEDSYQTTNGWWLIPTSEVTLTNIVAGHIVEEGYLPRRYTAHSLCFRSEAGSAGKDTRGMLRQHQFEKVEMVSVTHPDHSRAELDRMTGCAQGILEKLGLPYRTVVLCTGDMGFGARRTHDIEVWLPGQNTYREISSCSVCGDFQARRMNARFRPDGGGKPEFVHTLNGSGLAVGRCLIAVLENGQREDGSVALPPALAPWLGGASRITPEGALA